MMAVTITPSHRSTSPRKSYVMRPVELLSTGPTCEDHPARTGFYLFSPLPLRHCRENYEDTDDLRFAHCGVHERSKKIRSGRKAPAFFFIASAARLLLFFRSNVMFNRIIASVRIRYHDRDQSSRRVGRKPSAPISVSRTLKLCPAIVICQ